jgi:hypothetical protein
MTNEAVPLDPLYAMTEYERNNPVKIKRRKNYAYFNKWRASLPDHCWTCANYHRCYVTKQCKWNPYWTKEAGK